MTGREKVVAAPLTLSACLRSRSADRRDQTHPHPESRLDLSFQDPHSVAGVR
jgi:hypothetical protein